MTDSRKLDDLMDRYVFDLLDPIDSERVKQRAQSEPEWDLALQAAQRRKLALAEAVGTPDRPAAGFVSPEQVLAAGRAQEARQTRGRRIAFRVLAGVAAAAAVLVLGAWLRVALVSPPQTYLHVLGQAELASDAPAVLRAFVRTLEGQPRAGVRVTFALRAGEGDAGQIELAKGVSDESGAVAATVRIPAIEGQATLIACADDTEFSQVEAPIRIVRTRRVFLSTDKPIYQPGQTIHMRCLVLRKSDNRPDAGSPAEFTFTDPGGTVLMRQPVRLSEFGIAWCDLPLDELIAPGRYKVAVTAGSDTSEQSVEIFHYKLPAFAVRLKLERPYYLPGQTVSGEVAATYHFGKPVAGGGVELELADRGTLGLGTVAKATVTLDADGRAAFNLPLPATLLASRRTSGQASLLLTARARDTAGQENVGYQNVPVAQHDIRLTAVAENGIVNPQLPTRVYVVASFPDGRPAQTVIDVETLGQSMRTDEAGVAVIESANLPGTLRLSARTDDGRTGRADVSLAQAGDDGLILRTDKPLCRAGQTLNVEVLAGRAGEVFLDVLKDRQTILTRTLTVAGGRAQLALDLPAELSGTLRLHAYRLDSQGEWVGRDLLVVVPPADELSVKVSADQAEYRPGQDARLSFQVRDRSGKPAAAALSLAAVDEAVFSVQQAAPGLEGLLAGLDEELLRPAVEVHGFEPGLMSRNSLYAVAALQAAASSAADRAPKKSKLRILEENDFVGPNVRRGMIERWGAQGIRDELSRNPGLQERLGEDLVAELIGGSSSLHSIDLTSQSDVSRSYERTRRGAFDLAVVVSVVGASVGLLLLVIAIVIYMPDSIPEIMKFIFWLVALAMLLLLGVHSGAGVLAVAMVGVAGAIVALLLPEMRRHAAEFMVVLTICGLLVVLLLPSLNRSREMARRASVWADLSAIDKGLAMAAASRLPVREDVKATASGSRPARTRSYFPETLAWHPQIIADPSGRAELTIPLADSITTWRVAGSAVSADGRLGTVASSIRVFQPFFVDIDAPLTLTRGDEVSVPVVLYNYTDQPLKIDLTARAADGLSLLGDVDAASSPRPEVDPASSPRSGNVSNAAGTPRLLAPQQVARVLVRVRAERPGQATLTVDARAQGGQADSVRRSIRIVPPGRPAATSVSGTLADGQQTIALPWPADAVEGSAQVRFKVYPSTFSELLDGLENLFRQPYGCFEQTSSTTYPNVLALAYMRANNIESPETTAKALRYIQLGYQRLVGFEVSGGGFDWFGRPPANTVLTAYGLMEFADMAKVYAVDPALLKRTADWLASQQSADGSWRLERGCFHELFCGSEGGDLGPTAYVTWALASYNPSLPAVRRGAEYLAARAGEIRDPWTLALAANALLTPDAKSPAGSAAARRLAGLARRADRGQASWGEDHYRQVPATALAVLALSRRSEHAPLVRDALAWLAGRKDPHGTWGSTQGTVLALKALLAGTGKPQKRDQKAELIVRSPSTSEGGARSVPVRASDETPVVLTIAPEQSDAVHQIAIPAGPGGTGRQIVLDARNAAGMGYQLTVHYYTQSVEPTTTDPAGRPLPPDSRLAGPVSIDVQYDRTELAVNQKAAVRARLVNRAARTVNMVMADIGVPPGFSVDAGGLDRLVSARKIERYTLTARGVTVYLARLEGGASLDVAFDMTARMPLRAQAAPSTAWPYYEPEQMAAARPITVHVAQ